MTPPRRACILEDHPMMREHVRQRVESISGSWHVTFCGDDVRAALEHGWKEPFDCVLLDLDLGSNTSSADLSQVIGTGWPVVLMSVAGDPAIVQEGIAQGAMGFVAKHGELTELELAMASARDGRVWVTQDLAAKLASPQGDGATLTPDEQRVIMLRAAGMGPSAIARAFGRSEHHVLEILDSVIQRYRGWGEARG